jgi:microcystin-dependent protein
VKWNLNTNTTTSNDSMPVGSIMWYSTTTTPTGWLPADGAAVSRTTYATLFALISTIYGSGDGSTTFNVPSVASTTGKYFIRYTTSVGTVTTTSLATSPVGTMFDWPTTSSYPTGFLACDGSAVSRTSYANLFSLIGTTYGSGDGSTTFNLPSIVAAGTGSPVKIIKASLGGTVEPSTVAHAASHAAGGSDVISIKQSQINDYIFTTEAARDAAITSPIKGMRAYLTAPTIPAATSGGYTAVPTGIQTIYNGSIWVCVTEVGAGRLGNTGYATSSTTYVTALSDTTPISVTLSTGTSALVSFGLSGYTGGTYAVIQSISVSGATSIAASDSYAIFLDQTATAQQLSSTFNFVMTGLTSGTNTFTLNYRVAGSTGQWVRRHLVVKGVA